ncbi:16S rRNA (guanine1207-N2)-methyltransferase [Enteractinococcus coprophilus]|uniref:16S rRNA (Guanine1207-N2)-methyltransferase n=2 Tax=Enteractinococcus coprophilus TaxID=1027633 RepID=A0A543AJ86_9MICC|nr:16S rRNA (guanine1207-N2)-methyltransferase [Enteractinococcus coprophilus]
MMTQDITPDNVDRMLLRVLEETFTAEPWRREEPMVVINDVTGALSAWTLDQDLPVRFIQDSASLAAAHARITGSVAAVPTPEVLAGAATVVTRLARPLEALEELSWQVARWAAPEVIFLAGQLQRHLSFSFNPILERVFDEVTASRGYHKARALRAQRPKALTGLTPPRFPRKNTVTVAGQTFHLRAHGLTFGAARLDPGTQLLLETIQTQPPEQFTAQATVVDLGSGNGTVIAGLARSFAVGRYIATDDSASAVLSTLATLAANGIDGVGVMHQSGMVDLPDASADIVVLNPPFHAGTQLTSDIAFFLFDEAARTLKPGGVLLTVFNASRHYRRQLQHRVGPTLQLARDKRFIVTQSQKVH